MTGRPAAFVAVTRFGLGPNEGDLARATADPAGHVLSQIEAPPPAIPALAALPDRLALQRAWDEVTGEVRAARRAVRQAGGDRAAEALVEEVLSGRRRMIRQSMGAEIAARLAAGLSTPAPFVERLVLFWSNHLAVAMRSQLLRYLAGNYERTAVRPFVLGRYEDMLKAAVLHPAMLFYLDNQASVGPRSRAGRRRGRTINENLAREVLELHTLGVDGGYTQEDVRALALVLTGWRGTPADRPFTRRTHEPGPKTVLGRRYGRDGAGQAEAVLSDLARHPATARHLSGKLARHFTGDAPPAGLAGRLEAVWRQTDGDLAAVTRALVTDEAAWRAPPAKIIPPWDFVVSGARAFRPRPEDIPVRRVTQILGQPVWMPPAPTGWPDADDAWLGGDAVLERLDYADRFARRVVRTVGEPVAFARAAMGAGLDAPLETALARAESRRQAVALMLMSPQWQRR